MTGIYLKCESCGKTLGGEEVTPRMQGFPRLSRFQGNTLRERAAQLGWKHTKPDCDVCPECAAKERL